MMLCYDVSWPHCPPYIWTKQQGTPKLEVMSVIKQKQDKSKKHFFLKIKNIITFQIQRHNLFYSPHQRLAILSVVSSITKELSVYVPDNNVGPNTVVIKPGHNCVEAVEAH